MGVPLGTKSVPKGTPSFNKFFLSQEFDKVISKSQ